MKRLRHLPLFIVLFSALSFVSCDTEPVDPVLTENGQNPENPNNPNNPNNPGTGSYWPMAVNNTWTFNNGTENQDFKMIGTENISGNVYYKFDQFIAPGMTGGGENVVWVRQSGNNYIARAGMSAGGPSAPINLEYNVLKTDLNEGQTWTETATADTGVPGFPFTMITNGKIVEKGISITVDGETYNNVIHVEIDQNVMQMIDIESHFWFAQGVGPVKATTSAMGENTTYSLMAFDLN